MRGEAVVWATLWRNTLTLALSLPGRGETQGTPYYKWGQSSVYDFNFDGLTDEQDRSIIEQNLGTKCLQQSQH